MFSTIFFYELKYWLKQPSVYIYTTIFLLISAASMAGRAGLWDDHSNLATSGVIINSAYNINGMFLFMNRLILLILPTIIGVSIYRDYRSNMHTLLYSYPVTKPAYLLAKFISSFLVMATIVSAIGIGLFLGTKIPGVNESMLIPFNIYAYLQPYLFYVLPNILTFGIIVFSIVLFTRNICAGFVTIVVLLFLQGLINSLSGGFEHQFLAALLDPFGGLASEYYTRYWTVSEFNELMLPVKDVAIFNRLVWLSASAILMIYVYREFSFSQNAIILGFRKKETNPAGNKRPGSVTKVLLPKVQYVHSFSQNLKATWRLSGFEFNYIVKNWVFVSILITGFLFVAFQQAEMNPQFGFKTLPVTWKMLRIPAFMFLGVINLLTFLFAGMLIHRASVANTHQLADTTPAANWMLLLSKFIALLKMQVFLLSFIIIGGLLVQLYNGYYHFEIGHYLFELYILNFSGITVWTFAAVFIQTLFTNPYLGLFLLILGAMGMAGLPELGIEHFVFRFGLGPDYQYSDLDGYGSGLPPYLLFKFYWMLLGLFLFFGALLFWTRGLPHSFAERLTIARSRFSGKVAVIMIAALTCFFFLGGSIYYKDQILNNSIVSKAEEERWKAENEKLYKQYEKKPQPRIISVKMKVDIFPDSNNFIANGEYILQNRSANDIDTLLIHYSFHEITTYQFDKSFEWISRDTLHRFDIIRLNRVLQPGDSLMMSFNVKNKPNTFFQNNSKIKGNGTYFDNHILPGFGYRPVELTDNGKRALFGLPPVDNLKPHPSDSSALWNSYAGEAAGWIDFEAIMSTSEDQIALAPGYLLKEWTENGRRYFHYKMDRKIKPYFGFNSGRFEMMKDTWNDISLEIYYHKNHTYNLDRMMRGLKGSLAYNTTFFSPYQHKQARIIEFPITYGNFATTFANSIPFSEARFITDVDDEDKNSIDLPFYVAAHEMAHQWWGNQLIPADVLGAKMLTESMAEYAALKVLEREYGKHSMRKFLKMDLDLYLRGRGNEDKKEMPLMLSFPHQDYINYRKGSLVFYALSDYIGEENLNKAIRQYLEKVQFQDAPYTTSLEMMEYLRKAIPDSLQYVVTDMFETITLYDNYVKDARATALKDGKYQVTIEFVAGKYRSDEKGHRIYTGTSGDSLTWQSGEMKKPILSLPLADYIEIGIFGQKEVNGKTEETELYLQKHKISKIYNQVTFIVDEKPVAVGIDPYNKLIDINSGDNRRGF